MISNVVIAAAGLGSRLGHDRPKCLLEVEGETLLSRQLGLLRAVPHVVVVVGFESAMVTDAARAMRPDVTIVHNDDFENNTTRDSYAMGAAAADGPCVFMDADLIISNASFDAFAKACVGREYLIGIAPAGSDNCVYVHLDADHNVRRFSRSDVADHEWCNVVLAPQATFDGDSGWIYERLGEFLPLPSFQFDCYEIDTLADLDRYLARMD